MDIKVKLILYLRLTKHYAFTKYWWMLDNALHNLNLGIQ